MKRDMRKIFSFILILALVFGLIPASPVQALSPSVNIAGAGVNNASSAALTLTDGAVWTDKVVKSLGGGEFQITLSAIGQKYNVVANENPVKLDVVFVLDASQSMRLDENYNDVSNKKWIPMINAATAASEKVLQRAGNRVAFVAYSDLGDQVELNNKTGINQYFTATQSEVLNKITSSKLPTGTYTNIQDGLLKAHQLIKSAKAAGSTNKPIIVLMSDGEPNRYYTSMEDHSKVQKTSGSSADKNSVWYTVQQAMYTKQNGTTSISTDDIDIYTIGFDVETNAAKATLKPDATNMIPYLPSGQVFNHKYWTDSTFVGSTNTGAIVDAFLGAVNQASSFAPSQVVTTGTSVYNDVVVTDTLGNAFEYASIVGTTPTGLTLDGQKVIWKIKGDELKTVAAGSTSVAIQPNSISFKVKLKDSVTTAGRYYTNASALATFTVDKKNPAYGDTLAELTQTQTLLNNGWVDLATANYDVKVTINKTVIGAATGSNTFKFDVYSDENHTQYLTSTSITVNGVGTASKEVNLTLSANKFVNGTATISVKENESVVPKYWTYDNTEYKPVAISGTGIIKTGSVTFTNSYDPKGTLTVKKEWPEKEGCGNTTSIAITLSEGTLRGGVIDWSTVSAPYTIEKAKSWTLEIPGLSMNKYYKVNELPGELIQDYYATSSPGSVCFDPSNLERMITISNKYVQPTGTITIVKNWNGGTEEDLPNRVFFDYECDNGTTGSAFLTSQGAVIKDGVVTWKLATPNLGFGTYTITERKVQDYTAKEATKTVTISQEPRTSREATVTFDNSYVTPAGVLTVQKVWDNENKLNGNLDKRFRPDSIVVKVLQKLAGGEPATYDTVTLNEANGWMKTYDNLQWGTYSVEEITKVPDYSTTYSALSVDIAKGTRDNNDSRLGILTIKNIFENPKGQITVSKHWVESGLASYDRPTVVKVTLNHNGKEYASTTFAGIDNDWSYDFTDLPLDGTYTISESADGDDAVKLAAYGQSAAYSNGKTGFEFNPLTRGGNVVLTNTIARGSVTVNKLWDDKNNPGSERPAIVEIKLWQVKEYVVTENEDYEKKNDDGTTEAAVKQVTHSAIDTTVAAVQTIDRSKTPAEYSTTFYNLDLGTEDVKISYYAEEKMLPFYDTTYAMDDNSAVSTEPTILVVKKQIVSDDPSDIKVTLDETNVNGIINVTNTYTDPRGTIHVTKSWSHGNDPDGKTMSESVTVGLYQLVDGTPSFLYSKDFTGSCDFTGLTLGAVYTVKELDGSSKYDTTYAPEGFSYTPVKNMDRGSVADGSVVITNTYIPEQGTLNVTKTWDGPAGSEIKVILNRYYMGTDGQIADTEFNDRGVNITLAASTDPSKNWTGSFGKLDVYGPGGVKYDYRVQESGDNLWLYQKDDINDKQLNPNEQSDITINNVYTPTLGALTITKSWPNGSDDLTSINYQLYIDGVAEPGYRTLYKANNWTETLTGLDATKPYRVVEVNVPEEFKVEYSATGLVSGDSDDKVISFNSRVLEGSVTITNTRTKDDVNLKLTKKVDKDAVILKDGKAEFTYTLLLENTGNRTLNNISVDDEMTTSGKAVGATITYVTSSSLALSGPNGATITPDQTTLAPGATTSAVYTVIVDKAGYYSNAAAANYTYKNSTITTQPQTVDTWVKDLDLVIEKAVLSDKSVRGTGGTFIYQLTVRNAGDIGLYGVTIQDVMKSTNPDSTMTYSYSGELSYDADTHTFYLKSLPADSDDVVITYTVTVTGRGTYDNTATVTGSYEDEESGYLSDSDSEQVTVTKPSRPNPPDDPIVVPDDPTPESPVTPPAVVTTPDQTVIEDAIPAAPLPKTGGVAPYLIYGLGLLLAGGGLAARRKENKDK